MRNKKSLSALKRILEKVVKRIGAKLFIEPEWGVVGQITFKNGRRSYFRYNVLDANNTGASKIAKDKDYANFFMKSMGYPIVPGSKTFFSDEWGEAIGSPERNIHTAFKHAQKLGLPVIVKPNSGTQGKGVSLVHNKKEFYQAVRTIFKDDDIVIVEKLVSGRDYRLVILGKKLISAYERIHFNIVGDGKTTIRKLIESKLQNLSDLGRRAKLEAEDPRIIRKLKHQKLSLRSIPKRGERIYLLDNANLSTGGDSIDVTKKIHPGFKDIAVRLTRDMGLNLCGVDLMVEGDITKRPRKYHILEINSAPGLDHYTKIGKEQEKIVEDLYLKVLKGMEK